MIAFSLVGFMARAGNNVNIRFVATVLRTWYAKLGNNCLYMTFAKEKLVGVLARLQVIFPSHHLLVPSHRLTLALENRQIYYWWVLPELTIQWFGQRADRTSNNMPPCTTQMNQTHNLDQPWNPPRRKLLAPIRLWKKNDIKNEVFSNLFSKALLIALSNAFESSFPAYFAKK